MSAEKMAVSMSVRMIKAVCDALDCYDFDGEVKLNRKDGSSLALSAEEAKKITIVTLASVVSEMVAGYEENDDA